MEQKASARVRTGALRRRRILSIVAFLVLPGLPNSAAGQPGRPLTTAEDVLRLSKVESAAARPVSLRGVVTGFDPGPGVLFVQDRTAGVEIAVTEKPPHVNAGDRIDVEGVTTQGHFSPAVLPHRIQVLGRAPFPTPLRVPWLQILTGAKHGQWVEVTGDVTSVTTEGPHAVVRLYSSEGEIDARVAGLESADAMAPLVHSRVRVAGVCTPRFNAAKEFVGAVILVPGREGLVVQRPAPARPFDVPPTAFRDVLKYRDGDRAGDRILATGVVLLFRPGISLFVTDGDRSLYAETSATETLLPGDRVEVLGYPDFVGGAPGLLNAVYRRVGAGPEPQPLQVEAERLLDKEHDSGLISVDARLLSRTSADDQTAWLLKAGDQTFEAILDTGRPPPRLATIEPDSAVRVRGVCILRRGAAGSPNGLRLRLRSPDDLQLLEPPSWWTARRALMLAALVAAIALVVSGWTLSLRRQVRRQTKALEARLESEAGVREALCRSEARYRALFQGSGDALMTLALPSRTFSSGNPATIQMFGAKDEAEFTSQNLQALSPETQPDGRLSTKKAANIIETVMREGSHFFEWTHKRLSGQTFPATVLLTRVEAGGQVFLQATVRDITTQKQADEALARSVRVSGRLREFLADVSSYQTEHDMWEPLLRTAIDVCGASGGCVHSVAGESITLRHQRQLPRAIGRAVARLPRSAPFVQAVLGSSGPLVFTDQEPVMVERLRAHGLRHVASIALRSESGPAACLSLTLDRAEPFSKADLHYLEALALEAGAAFERIHRQRLLREHASRLRQILDTAATAVFMVDASRRITEVNDAFCLSTGFSPEEAVGQRCDILQGQPCLDRCGLYDAAGAQSIFHRQCAIHAKDGRRLAIIKNATVIRDDSGTITGGVESFVDVTSLVEARRAAEMASAAKSQFLANMSHEIRTPMTAIMGYADVLLEAGNLADAFPERIEAAWTIKRNGEYLLDLLNDILDLSKIEAGRFEVERTACSPLEVVAQVASLMRVRSHAKRIGLRVAWEGRVPEVIQSDATRVRQILINLVGNAIKFTEAGHVELSARMGVLRGGAQALEFDVVDTGVGMTKQQTVRLFEPFSQADASMTRKYGGTGLGLAISRRLAEALGGHVRLVQTTSGVGSRFRLVVPTGPLDGVRMVEHAPDDLGVVLEKLPEAAAPVARLDCRVLLAEDGPDNQRLISRVLEKAGAEVTIVENGQLAVEAALAPPNGARAGARHPFDVILMDLQMPEMDGLTATATLRAHGYAGSIVALTAHAMESDRQECLRAGCDDYVSKPIDRRTLIEIVWRHAKEGRARTEEPVGPPDPIVSELAGDPDLADLLEEFTSELPARARAIEQACTEGEFDILIRLAHQLKGSAGGYGFPSITEEAANLERIARNRGDREALMAAVRSLTDLCGRTQHRQATGQPSPPAPSLVSTV